MLTIIKFLGIQKKDLIKIKMAILLNLLQLLNQNGNLNQMIVQNSFKN